MHSVRLALLGTALAVAPCALAGPTWAQSDSTNTGSIHGRVLFDDRPASFANVIVLGTRRGSQCDETGRFRITGVPPGRWRVKAQSFHAIDTTPGEIAVTAGSDTELTLTLQEDAQHRMRRHPVPECDAPRESPAQDGRALPDTTGWWTASGSIFDFSLPIEFRRKQVMGIDSEVGEWDADSTRITYDLGDYTGCAQPASPELGSAPECLGGLHARVRLSTEDGTLQVEACFPALGLGLYGSTKDEAERARILAAFRTIRFHDRGAPPLLTGLPAPTMAATRSRAH